MDLARVLLLQISEDSIREDEWDQQAIYHLKMLTEVGYIQGIKFMTTWDGDVFGLANPQLTWAGHEFLDTIRSKKMWDKIKGMLKDKGVDLSIEAIKIAAPQAIATALS
jgi:Hypothetical protein (DUF2513)